MFKPIIFLILFQIFNILVRAETDFTLECRRGYRIVSIKRVGNVYHNNSLGSLAIECEKIHESESEVTCEALQNIPQCNGLPEGCAGSQWLGGFHVYLIENATSAVLLDPICCSTPSVRIDSRSCIEDRLNSARSSFEHGIAADLTYRGLRCWHQYNANQTLVDLVWKMEVCSFSSDTSIDQNVAPEGVISKELCPACQCHCGIDTCGNGREPVRIIHKNRSRKGCGCECDCYYQCT
uniref:SRCR domain-containing protein n=1 Tax=Steinernema glaseri TaxID=37863 RepID=A0A1I7ZEV9_9BILA